MADTVRQVLQYVKEQRALDFSIYRPATIRRRLEQRIAAAGLADQASYLMHLKADPKELDRLIATLTIAASRFFRDPLVFEILGRFVLPELLNQVGSGPLRIWCAGCARGEEPYSLAILVKELAEKSERSCGVTIIATDIDREVLAAAERGEYDAESVGEVRKRQLDRYFVSVGDKYRISDEIKELVSFVYHDLVTCRPPKEGVFADYHLILCRNVLIYFKREVQDRIQQCFLDSLAACGVLVLGDAESIPDGVCTEVFPRAKIFRKGGCSA